jgi:diguanylate cyclase (GGDEF)-like protein/PAS domain S-box-containing protein
MLSIINAFDAMTTDQVYRPAWSRERALAELFQFAGTQFDPDLVKQFSELHAGDPNQLQAKGAQHWLESLAADASNAQWRLGGSERPRGEPLTPDALFEQKLLNNMRDGVVFVDSQLQIFLWNRGAERLTGIPGSAVYLRHWVPSLLSLRDLDRRLIRDEDCSITHTVQTGVQSYRRVILPARNGSDVPVDLHAMAVIGKDGTTYGATVVLHDVSPETSLEERCQSLHDQATKDPLTGVANRAEFDRMHERFIQAHLETRLPCSLIVCDIDHFKRVNDEYGHQAGDEAIKSLATLLKSKCQPGDLVARYGGEEFVMLCADCNNAAVAQRAEQIRRELADMILPVLGNEHITASFGVTELQPGDTPDTMFRRADRALLQAKDMGRNLVVQLGTGMSSEEPKRRWWSFQRSKPDSLVETQLFTSVPIGVAVEKLRGFMADHDATINSVTADQLQLTIAGTTPPWQSGDGERFVPLVLDMQFAERYLEQPAAPGSVRSSTAQTCLHVAIRPRRSRDGRREETTDRARQVLASLKSYLIATEKPLHRARKFAKSPQRSLFAWGSGRKR